MGRIIQIETFAARVFTRASAVRFAKRIITTMCRCSQLDEAEARKSVVVKPASGNTLTAGE
jgi:hypothetical protein